MAESKLVKLNFENNIATYRVPGSFNYCGGQISPWKHCKQIHCMYINNNIYTHVPTHIRFTVCISNLALK